jgi:hypothetical protein
MLVAIADVLLLWLLLLPLPLLLLTAAAAAAARLTCVPAPPLAQLTAVGPEY